MDEKLLRNEMNSAVKCHNKLLTAEYLDSLSIGALVANLHPLYRADYADKVDDLLKSKE